MGDTFAKKLVVTFCHSSSSSFKYKLFLFQQTVFGMFVYLAPPIKPSPIFDRAVTKHIRKNPPTIKAPISLTHSSLFHTRSFTHSCTHTHTHSASKLSHANKGYLLLQQPFFITLSFPVFSPDKGKTSNFETLFLNLFLTFTFSQTFSIIYLNFTPSSTPIRFHMHMRTRLMKK